MPATLARPEHLRGEAAAAEIASAATECAAQLEQAPDGLANLAAQPEAQAPASEMSGDPVVADVDHDPAPSGRPPRDVEVEPSPEGSEIRPDPHARHVRVAVEPQAHLRPLPGEPPAPPGGRPTPGPPFGRCRGSNRPPRSPPMRTVRSLPVKVLAASERIES